jgi:hypothetical protein
LAKSWPTPIFDLWPQLGQQWYIPLNLSRRVLSKNIYISPKPTRHFVSFPCKSYFCKSGLNIRKEIYINQCLKKITLPFIREYHNNRPYVLWPDKALSHLANFFNTLKTKTSILFHTIATQQICHNVDQ